MQCSVLKFSVVLKSVWFQQFETLSLSTVPFILGLISFVFWKRNNNIPPPHFKCLLWRWVKYFIWKQFQNYRALRKYAIIVVWKLGESFKGNQTFWSPPTWMPLCYNLIFNLFSVPSAVVLFRGTQAVTWIIVIASPKPSRLPLRFTLHAAATVIFLKP